MKQLKELQDKLRQFAKERDWERYHSPKNLAAALSVEASELLEIFQWLTEEESHRIKDNPKELQKVREELADIFLYLLRISDELGVDLLAAGNEKFVINGKKYPVKLAKGNAKKYNRR